MSALAVTGGWLFLLVVVSSVMLTRVMIGLAIYKKWVVTPKADRWSQTVTALYGGVGIVIAFAIGAAATMLRMGTKHPFDLIGLFAGAAILFVVGILDDARPLDPQVKLVGQLLAIMPFLVGAGLAFTSKTFVVAIPLVLFWMLALTNAFNLLDNMDGLSAGTAAIIGAVIGMFAIKHGSPLTGVLAFMVTGSCLGFLCYNFRAHGPAKIFMGDCGSMFLGYMLSGLAVIAFCPVTPMPLDAQIARCVLPLLIMAVPIFDTTLVIIIRKREGRAVSQGGRDHSSHRLVYSGRTDKEAVLLLFCLSAITGAATLVLGRLNNSGIVFAAIGLEVLILICFGVYLNRYPGASRAAVRLPGLPVEVETAGRQLVEAGTPPDGP